MIVWYDNFPSGHGIKDSLHDFVSGRYVHIKAPSKSSCETRTRVLRVQVQVCRYYNRMHPMTMIPSNGQVVVRTLPRKHPGSHLVRVHKITQQPEQPWLLAVVQSSGMGKLRMIDSDELAKYHFVIPLILRDGESGKNMIGFFSVSSVSCPWLMSLCPKSTEPHWHWH